MNTVISQALATGLPVATTRHSGLPDQVQDGFNGFLVDEGDYVALAERILYFLNNRDQWAELGRHAREHVLAKYDRDVLISKQIDCYLSLVDD